MRLTSNKWVRRIAVAALVAAGLAMLALLVAERLLGPALHRSVIAKLERRFDGKIELADLQISLAPRVVVAGSGLRLHHRGRADVPPLISMKKFTAHLYPWDLLRRPVRVRSVIIEGLEIRVPPKRKRNDEKEDSADRKMPARSPKDRYPFLIERVIADGTVLTMLPKKVDDDPLVWEIYQLDMRSVGIDRPMNFQATLKNAKPPGFIDSSGGFGPWREDDPGQTFVSGTYTFKDADLSVFKGLAGKLSSTGSYNGILERIQARGTTDTPDFRLDISGNPVHLRTEFEALIDGTNGDTRLEPVKATFGRTHIDARGGVTHDPGVKGKTIRLQVALADARVEDLLRLAAKGATPFLTGALRFDTAFLLPPGDSDVVDRLHLNGHFALRSGQFTRPAVREKLADLSWKARGRPKGEEGKDSVASNMTGRFVLRNGTMSFSTLSFSIPGASVHLDGSYGLRGQQLDFHGKLRMQARISQTQTGVKSFLLKVVDPFFAKEGAGTVLPIKVTGTQEHPTFGAEFRRKK